MIDNGLPALSNWVDIHVEVTEVNSPPELLPIASRTAIVGMPLRFQAKARDADFPVQRLTFGLAGGSPLGAGINPGTGDFSWTPSTQQVGSYTMTVEVADDGIPPLTHGLDFAVTVKEPDPVPAPVVSASWAVDGSVTLSWWGVEGVAYQIQFKESLNDAVWSPLAVVVGAGGVAGLSGIDPTEAPERYYRVVAIP